MDRRTFIKRSSTTLAAVSTPVITPLSAVAVANNSDTEKLLTAGLPTGYKQQDMLTIAAVQNHLFPSETDAPGAVEINATSYLNDFLTNPQTDQNDIAFILSGVRKLQTAVLKHQNKTFIDLSIEQRESELRAFEKTKEGRRWLINILNYLMEALLTDPVYGGNPNGIGWEWLEHQAGQPRPPANKRYWLL